MAATKHRLTEGDVAEDILRPEKKTKTAADANLDDANRLKKERKDKKKQKKLKKQEAKAAIGGDVGDDQSAGDDQADAEEQRKAAKKLKKAEKKAKKDKKNTDPEAMDVDESKPEVMAEKSKSKKDKKNKPTASPDEDPTGLSYTQTISLSEVPQAEIDTFLTKHEITMTDPKNKVISLRPVTEFHHLPTTNLLEKKPSPFATYTTPTPIQAASWPFTLSRRDAIGVAETGSGKTMAFALPCVEAVMKRDVRGVKAVIVSPTRELAMQTHVQLDALAKLVRLRCICIYGGASKDDQRALLQRGADIIVATPGRLKDFMSDDTVQLGQAKFVVLDEADRMLDKGFEEDIKMILGACPPREQRQTLMFTATWPQSVQALASTFMVSPVRVAIGSGGKETASGAVELQANARIVQQVEVVEPQDKEFRLLQLVKKYQHGKAKDDRILVFCLYKKEATRVEGFLSRKGIRVTGIHGDLKQEQRTKSLEAFKNGSVPVLVATDVAARGLDIPEVKLVINVTVSISASYEAWGSPDANVLPSFL